MTTPHSEPKNKWRILLLLSLAELLGMAVWFSASAVVPELTETWGLTEGGKAWLTMSVQVGFVVGAFVSAVLNLADRLPANRLFAGTSILAGISTALIPILAEGVRTAILLRFFSGVFLAGVYPVGMKIMATWTQRDRGLGIGLLVGALTIGSAAPHLINAFGGVENWQFVMFLAASLAILGGVLAIFFVEEGPFQSKTPPFDWKYVGKILRERGVMLANLGYLGHMWELYAMWAWIPVFLVASFQLTGVDPVWASIWAFAVIGIGGLGSAIAGKLADRYGRTRVITASLVISGGCAVTIGRFFGGNPIILVGLSLVWGFTVVADSAQFSASVSELAKREYTGTALTLQTSLGFLLTLITIRLIPTLERLVSWKWAFAFLIIGPLLGIWAMEQLRKSPEAVKLSGDKDLLTITASTIPEKTWE